jgi:hypothetical protein
MRLIDYDEIRKLFDEEYKRTMKLIRGGETHLDNLAEGYVGADKVIYKLPDVDAVEVVRCKDCRFSRPVIGTAYLKSCEKFDCEMWHEGFCYYGERKEVKDA